MPMTKIGKEVMKKMAENYGKEKGKNVFYASINKKKKGTEQWHEAMTQAMKNKIKKTK